MEDFSIIIPTLDEKKNIRPLLQKIEDACQNSKYNFEVIFVDDGSTDGTRHQIETYPGPLEVRLICRDSQKGLSTAVIAGSLVSQSDVIVVMDADLSHPPDKILQLVKPIIEKQRDMVLGSRYSENGQIAEWPLTRKISSQIASIPARILTGVKDPLSGFFAVQKNTLLKVNPNLRGYKIGLEILSRERENIDVAEVPINFVNRSAGYSKMSKRVISEYFLQLVSLFGLGKSFTDLSLLFLVPLLAGIFDGIFYSILNTTGTDFVTNHLISYLAAMHLFYPGFLLLAKPQGQISQNIRKFYLPFLTITFLGLFLRGGVLALSGALWGGASIQTAGILSVTTVFTALVYELKIRQNSVTGHFFSTPTTQTFIFSIITYTLALRFFYLGAPELIQEEAYYWNYAQHMSGGYLDHPPGVAVLIWLGTAIFGTNEFGVRIGAFLCWFVTAGFTYRFVRSIFDANVALRSVLLLATLPIFFGVGLIMTPDAPLIASWAGALYFLHEAFIKNKSRSWIGAGICLGIGLASKYTIAFLAPAIVLFMVLDPHSRKMFFKPHPYLAALLALAIFSPVILWNYNHEWASFLFQSQRRLTKAAEFSTHELLASILILLTPTGFLAVIASMKRKSNRNGGNSDQSNLQTRSFLFCATMALIPLSIFILFSFTKEIKLNWTGPLWLALIPFVSYNMIWPDGKLNRVIAGAWRPTIVTFVLIYGAVLHYFSLGLPGVPFSKDPFMVGWDDLASQVEEIVQTVSGQEGQRPIVAGMGKYRIASGMAFYRYKNLLAHPENDYTKRVIDETTGCHLFGYNALMYKYWHNPEDMERNSIIVIGKDEKTLSPLYFKNHFAALGPIKTLKNMKNGQLVGTYYYRQLKGYSAINDSGNLLVKSP